MLYAAQLVKNHANTKSRIQKSFGCKATQRDERALQPLKKWLAVAKYLHALVEKHIQLEQPLRNMQGQSLGSPLSLKGAGSDVEHGGELVYGE